MPQAALILAYAVPFVVMLYLAGAKWFEYTRFERTVYRAFRARMAEGVNPDPATQQVWVHAVIYGTCALLIVSLYALTKKSLVAVLFTVLLVLMLGIWDLRSLPLRLKRRQAWLKTLSPEDRALIRTSRKMRLQAALILAAALIYGYIILHIDSLLNTI